jgi:S1-C subfamily serine protease
MKDIGRSKNMGRPRFLTALITIFILLLGLLIGMSILGVEENSFNPLPDQKKPEVTVHPPQESSVFGGDNLIGTNAVRDIVAACGDSIIKIETEVTVTSNTNPFFNDPFFREFFGGSFPQETKKQTGLGSGFIFAEDGYILTNHHVIDGADKINVYLSSREEPYEAKIMGKAPELDLAVLKIEGNQPFPYLSMGDSDLVQVGDWVTPMA